MKTPCYESKKAKTLTKHLLEKNELIAAIKTYHTIKQRQWSQ